MTTTVAHCMGYLLSELAAATTALQSQTPDSGVIKNSDV